MTPHHRTWVLFRVAPLRIAHVVFPRPNLLRPVSEAAWDAIRALGASGRISVEPIVPIPAFGSRKLQRLARLAVGASPWPDGLELTLRALEPRPTLVRYLPLPGRSIESAAVAIASSLVARANGQRPALLEGSFLGEGGFAAVAAARAIGCPSIAVAHGNDARAATAPDARIHSRPRDRALWTLHHASEVVADCHELAGDLARAGRKAEIIPFSARPDLFRPAPIPDGPPIVLFVGSLGRAKGVDLLIEAMARVRRTDSVLTLVGPRSHDLPIGPLVERYTLERRVHVSGELSQAALPSVYARSTCVVLPAPAAGLATALIEALLVGRPVVAADAGVATQIVDDHVGRLVPPHDVHALAGAIDAVLGARFDGEALRSRALPFSWAASADKLESLARRMT